jgi:hypothetical protein
VPANLLALAVAVAFFVFAMQWRGAIIFVTVLALFFFGMRYLYRNHPLARIFITGFCRGLGGRRPGFRTSWRTIASGVRLFS